MSRAASTVLLTTIAVCSAVAVYQAFARWGPEGAAAPRAIKLAGVVMASEAIVSAPVAARLERLLTNAGDRVERGQTLAALDRRQFDARVAYHASRVAQLRRQLEQIRQASERRHEATAEALQALDAQHAAAAERARDARSRAQPTRRLAGGMIVPEKPASEDWIRLDVAETLLVYLDQRRQAAQSELLALELGAGAPERSALEAGIAHEQSLLAEASASREAADLKAPKPGRVSLVTAAEGEIVRPGQPVITIVDPEDIWVAAAVEETLLSRVEAGRALPVELASGERLEGRVTSVAPEGEFATQRDVNRSRRDIRAFSIRVKLPGGRAHPGMTAYVLLPSDSR